jgi:SnoaL-like domain
VAALQVMDRENFEKWLTSYGDAWISRDPTRAASLYTDDATYQVTPFDDPFRGQAAIYDYWKDVTTTEQDIAFDYQILAVTAEYGIARWRASFVRVPPGLNTKLDGILLISLHPGGRCQSLREWWHKRQ